MSAVFTYTRIDGQEGLDVADAVVHFLNQATANFLSGNMSDAAENLASMGNELKNVAWEKNTERSLIQQIAVCSKASLLGLEMVLTIKPSEQPRILKDIAAILPYCQVMDLKLECIVGIDKCEKAKAVAEEVAKEVLVNDNAPNDKKST